MYVYIAYTLNIHEKNNRIEGEVTFIHGNISSRCDQ